MNGDKVNLAIQLKVSLEDIDPPIWRRLLMPGNASLEDLHWTIQQVMGWLNYHLHEFHIGERRVGRPDYSDDFWLDDPRPPLEDARSITLMSLLSEEVAEFGYRYDFGDDWNLSIQLERAIEVDEPLAAPECLEGERAGPPDSDPFADWSAHLFTVERRQFILVANTPSLYSVVMPGRGVTSDKTFLRRMRVELRGFLQIEGYEYVYRKLVEPGLDKVLFSKALNRSVTGSINDLVFGAKFFMTGNEMPLFEVSVLLNETPMSYLDYNPREAFRSLTDEYVNPDGGEGERVQSRRVPRSPEEWLEEIREAYADAISAIPFERRVNRTFGEQELYHLAPSVAVKFRGLRSDETSLRLATEAALSSYVANMEEEQEALSDPRLAFAFCYLASHYGLDLAGVATIEDVMEFLENHKERIDESGSRPERPGGR